MKDRSRARVLSLLTAVLASLAACGGAEETPAPGAPGSSSSGDAPAGTSSSDPASPAPTGTGTPTPPTPPPGPVAPTCTGREKLTGNIELTVTGRAVQVHIPPTYDPTKGVPVVLNFHGLSSNPSDQALYSGMNTKSDAAGFIAVHAQGVGNSWNAGACCGTASSTGVKDVDFVSAVIDELAKKLCLDDKRVFATGLSNGGFLSHRLGCELSGRIAAIAPVAGVMGIPTCTPARAVSVMQFHGTSDGLVPYNGNAFINYPSVPSTVAKWGERNECKDKAHETFKKEDVQCMTQSQCKGGAEVTLCTVTGGGHTWPGASVDVGLGKTTLAIKATDAMWDFFVKHPMP